MSSKVGRRERNSLFLHWCYSSLQVDKHKMLIFVNHFSIFIEIFQGPVYVCYSI